MKWGVGVFSLLLIASVAVAGSLFGEKGAPGSDEGICEPPPRDFDFLKGAMTGAQYNECREAHNRVLNKCRNSGYDGWMVLREMSIQSTGKPEVCMSDAIVGGWCPPVHNVVDSSKGELQKTDVYAESIMWDKGERRTNPRREEFKESELFCDFSCFGWNCPGDFDPDTVIYDGQVTYPEGSDGEPDYDQPPKDPTGDSVEELIKQLTQFAKDECSSRGPTCNIKEPCKISRIDKPGDPATQIVRVECDCNCKDPQYNGVRVPTTPAVPLAYVVDEPTETKLKLNTGVVVVADQYSSTDPSLNALVTEFKYADRNPENKLLAILQDNLAAINTGLASAPQEAKDQLGSKVIQVTVNNAQDGWDAANVWFKLQNGQIVASGKGKTDSTLTIVTSGRALNDLRKSNDPQHAFRTVFLRNQMKFIDSQSGQEDFLVTTAIRAYLAQVQTDLANRNSVRNRGTTYIVRVDRNRGFRVLTPTTGSAVVVNTAGRTIGYTPRRSSRLITTLGSANRVYTPTRRAGVYRQPAIVYRAYTPRYANNYYTQGGYYNRYSAQRGRGWGAVTRGYTRGYSRSAGYGSIITSGYRSSGLIITGGLSGGLAIR